MQKRLYTKYCALLIALCLTIVLLISKDRTIDIQTEGIVAGWFEVSPQKKEITINGHIVRCNQTLYRFEGQITIEDFYDFPPNTMINLFDGSIGFMYNYDDGYQLESQQFVANVFTDNFDTILIHFQNEQLKNIFFVAPASNKFQAAQLAKKLSKGTALEEVDWDYLFKTYPIE